jgi:hypothetical protein
VSAGGANVIASSAAVHAGLRPIEFAVAGIPMLQFSIGSVAILSTLTSIGTALLMTMAGGGRYTTFAVLTLLMAIVSGS